MPMVFGLIFLFLLFLIYKLVIDGLLFRIILFLAGWFGIYVICRLYFQQTDTIAIAFILRDGHSIEASWAMVIPSIICFLCLLTTKE